MSPVFRNKRTKWLGFIVCILLLSACFAGSIVLGATPIAFSDAVRAFIDYDSKSVEHIVVITTRLPRAILALVVGASLAAAGALMQALTKNPLASPSIFGVNAGAIFFVILAMTLFSVKSLTAYIWIAFIGGAVAAMIVYLLSFVGGRSPKPVRIVLAGSAITALFTSFTQGMLVLNEQGLQDALFWLAGSVSSRLLEDMLPMLPFALFGLIMALMLTPSMNVFATGDDVARGLGQRTGLVKLIAGIVIVVLAGSSVAVAGMIGFVGLIVPHVARLLVGQDYRWVIPFSMVLGAVLLLAADTIGRFPIHPEEVPIGVMTAVIGTPFFLYLARKGLRGE